MAVNSIPRFIEQPKTWKTRVSVANPSINGGGTFATLMTGSSPNGSKIDYMVLQAVSTTQINMLRFWLETSNATLSLYDELRMSANSGAKAGFTMWSGTLTPAVPLIVPSGWSVKVSIHSANTVDVFGFGGDY